MSRDPKGSANVSLWPRSLMQSPEVPNVRSLQWILVLVQLALRIKTRQPRIAKIERAAADVSLDQILRAFAAAGGKIKIKQPTGTAKSSSLEIGLTRLAPSSKRAGGRLA